LCLEIIMDGMPHDLTHQELMDTLLAELASLKEDIANRDAVYDARLQALAERLDGGGSRFMRLENLLEQAQADRRGLNQMLTGLGERLIALETAKAIASGVSQAEDERIARWRRGFYIALVFLFGNGTAFSLLLWWLDRNPPT
jgi:hypothetical protein